MQKEKLMPATGLNYSGISDSGIEPTPYHPEFWFGRWSLDFQAVCKDCGLIQNFHIVHSLFQYCLPVLDEWTRAQNEAKVNRYPCTNPRNAGRKPASTRLIFICLLVAFCSGLSILAFSKAVHEKGKVRAMVMALNGSECMNLPAYSTIQKYFSFLSHDGVFDQINLRLVPVCLDLFKVVSESDLMASQVGKSFLTDSSIQECGRANRTQKEHRAVKDRVFASEFGGIRSFNQECHMNEYATFTSKHGRTWYGVKLHALTEAVSRIITSYCCTPAHVHDVKAVVGLVANSPVPVPEVKGDSGYCGDSYKDELLAYDCILNVIERQVRGKPLSDEAKVRNRHCSKIRSRVEHTFSVFKNQLGFQVRAVSEPNIKGSIGMGVLAHNIRVLTQLKHSVPGFLLPHT